MSQKIKTAITPTREENYPEWYQEVVSAADLAEHSPVRGCMVIKPWGYSLWENIQQVLDRKFKETGHQNAYFPLFIPLSFLEKEAAHVEGFAKECAVVTHHRLEMGKEGKLVPAGELEEPLIVRPTSEMIIGAMFAKWIESYRDLPLLINQWANVVRWELRTRLFLRTTEFLWQEGHTAHATRQEAQEETMRMLNVYVDFVQNFLAIPAIPGEKTPSERFPGAVATYSFELMMQDRKALQGGTSHFLGQNFAKGSGIQFRDAHGETQYAWTTSWGVTTRLIGAIIMTHSDDDGLVLPPRIASAHVVILPVMHKEETKAEVLSYCHALAKDLRQISYEGRPLVAIVDERDMRGGDKMWSWVKKGVPLRIEVGPRDMAADLLPVARRDRPHRESKPQSRGQLLSTIIAQLEEMQKALFEKALRFKKEHIQRIDSKDDFYAFFTPKNKEQPEIHGGFAFSHWSGDALVEEQIKKDLGVTIRCIPLSDEGKEAGICPISGKKSACRVIYAKAY
ncbi:MAG TPA: proline--tRNA ligase [Rhabdochlamydiaceae bacterium]|nr:proline--tRNA ligase [Rhabdochlamydiaceae bacterium]